MQTRSLVAAAIVLVTQLHAPTTIAQGRKSALAAFRLQHGPGWDLTEDPASGQPRRLTGGAIALLDAASAADTTSLAVDDEVLARAQAFLRANADLLGIDPAQLRPTPGGRQATASGRLRTVAFDVTTGGVPILGAHVTLVISRGNLIYVQLVGTAAIDADTTPRIDATRASDRLLGSLSLTATDLVAPPEVGLFVRPTTAGGGDLVWRVTIIESRQPRRWVGLVDAITADLIEVRDETVAACAPPTGVVARRILGGVRQESADDLERVELLGFASGSSAADEAGRFSPAPEPYAGQLHGPAATVYCDACTSPGPLPLVPLRIDADVDFGSGGTDAVGNGQATPADRASFYHTVGAEALAARYLPTLDFIDYLVPIRTNIASACNAYWDGRGLNFFRSSAQCANTGEIRDVIMHEWGHGLDDNDGLPPPGLAIDAATGEAAADIVALVSGRDACIGESFWNDPARQPSPGCSGVRDLDEKSPGHIHGSPATMTVANAASLCPASAFYRGVLGREGHCESEIFGQTIWHLVQNLRTGVGYGTGTPLADPALTDDAAWELVEQLYFDSRAILASYAPSTLQSIGVSAYDAFLLADDEGDGIATGTPHAEAINDAFLHHGIAEPTLVTDAAACAPVAEASAVTAIDEVDLVSGLPQVRITWTDIASVNRVLRADDADEAWLALRGPTAGRSFIDRGVLPGRTYRYRVISGADTACPSVGAAIATVAVDLPLVQVKSLVVDDRFPGDSDGLLEVGEQADITIELVNDGTAAATGLNVRIASMHPGLVVTVPGPIAFGTIAPGAVASGAPFRVRVDPGTPAWVFLVISAEATDGTCLRAETLLPLAVPDLAKDRQAIDDSTGDGDGVWDPGETIDLTIWLENHGLADALAVDGTLVWRTVPVPGVTLVRPTAGWGTVVAGAPSIPTAPPLFQLMADLSVPRRTRIELQLETRISGAAHRSLAVDLEVGSFPPGGKDWVRDSSLPIPRETTPIVIQLTDDDGDGAITGCDVPDVVYTAMTLPGGRTDRVVALSGSDGSLLWKLDGACADEMGVWAAIAGGDIDADGDNEIIFTGVDGIVCAITSVGTELWRTAAPVRGRAFRIAPQIWDLDGDGLPEVLAGGTVLRGGDGSVVWEDAALGSASRMMVGDIDLDGTLEIVHVGGRTYHADGSLYPATFPNFDGFGALVNLDADPEAEVVTLAAWARAYEHTGALIWETLMPGAGVKAIPCFADFDHDGLAETAVASENDFVLIDDDGSIRWAVPVVDTSYSSAGCTIIDLDGDGSLDIVHQDTEVVMVLDSRTGERQWTSPAPTGTAYEVPIIADVDADGSAEIVVVDGCGSCDRITVYGNPAWQPARTVWHQESYSVNEIEESGRVVSDPAPRWLSGNDLRSQDPVPRCFCLASAIAAGRPDCNLLTICFDAAPDPNAAAPVVVTWDYGDGSPPETAFSPCHTYALPGTYSVRAVIRDGDNCTAVRDLTVEVGVPLIVDFITTGQCNSCFAASVFGGVPPYQYEWDWDDGSPRDTADAACHTFPPGLHDVTLFVRDDNGCLAEQTHSVDPTIATPATVGNTLRGIRAGADATFSWSTPAFAETFDIRRDTIKQFSGFAVVASVPSPTYRDTPPLLPIHHYRIVGVNCVGDAGP